MGFVRGIGLAVLAAGLAGCGVAVPRDGAVVGVEGITGRVHGGQQPVVGSTVQLYTVGTGGDGSASAPLLTSTVTTDANGNFSITGMYSCSSATQVYLVATGGNPGSGTNANLAMMTALGPCSGLTSGTFVYVNELTTVAGVSALAPYMSSLTAVGSGTSDAGALASAFTLAGELVATSTGMTPGVNVPAGYAVPTAEISTLGNVLASCINSTGGSPNDGSSCGTLFSLTTPGGGTAPTNTVVALLDLANNPALHTSALFSMASPTGPFQPQLLSSPANFVVDLTPTGSLTELTITPSPVVFPTMSTGFTSPTVTATVTNGGSAAVTIDSIGITGTLASEFTQVSDCGTSLGAGASCTVQMTVTPASVGANNATLAVASNAPNSPATATLQAAGAAPSAGPITLSASSLNFTVADAYEDITVSNYGTTTLTIGSIVSSSNGFTYLTNCGTTLAAQSVCTISVTSLIAGYIAPPGGSGYFTYTATLTINDDASSGPQTVQLSSTNTYTGTSACCGSAALGSSATGSLTFSEANGHASTTFGPGTFSGTYASDYTASPNYCSVGGTLPPFPTSCSFNVTFRPSTTGTQNAEYVLGAVNGINQYLPLTGSTPTTTSGPAMNPTGVAFGAVYLDRYGNANATTQLGVYNDGTTTLNLSAKIFSGNITTFGVTSGAGCTALAPGSTCYFTVTFNATAAGNYSGTILLADANSTLTRTIAVPVTVYYLSLSTNPGQLTYGSQAMGTQSAAQTFTVSDSNGNPLGHALSAVASTGYTLTSGSTCPASTTTLCTLSVAFAPVSTSGGTIYGSVTVTDQVSGNYANENLTGTETVSPTISFSPNPLTFANRSVGTTSIPSTVTLTNAGPGTLTVSSVSLTGVVNNNFSETNNCTSVAVNGTCSIYVTFAPTVSGTQSATLQVVSNASGSPNTMTVSGTAM